ncbi:MAG: alpha/beta fold hydrolase [Parahaliea sp.]
MPTITANNIDIAYDALGKPADKPLLMVMGLGMQSVAWDLRFCQQLVDCGHYVIRFDNRDVGLSTHFPQLGVPDMMQIGAELAAGGNPAVPYTLGDMAADALGLLSALNIEQAHICGASLGGMISQVMAAAAPQRILSLTSIMSSTGNPGLPPADPRAMAALTMEQKDDAEFTVQRALEIAKIIGSPGFPMDEERIRERTLESFERSFDPAGVARQLAAALTQGDRRPQLRSLQLPCLVIHGRDDPLVPLAGGLDTHANVAGSELMVIDGMGHDLPQGVWPDIVKGISALTSRA